jgi:hypothetical protein
VRSSTSQKEKSRAQARFFLHSHKKTLPNAARIRFAGKQYAVFDAQPIPNS